MARGSTLGDRHDSASPDRRSGPLPFALSFADGEGRLTLDRLEAPPLTIHHLELGIEGLTFPFDLTGGPSRLRDRWLTTRELEVSVGLDELRLVAEQLTDGQEGLSDISLSFAGDAIEIVGRIPAKGSSPWFVLRYVPDIDGNLSLCWRPELFLLLGPPIVSFPQVAVAIGRLAAFRLGLRGLSLVVDDIPRKILQKILLPAGYRLPDCRRLKLSSLELGGSRLKLCFSGASVLPAKTNQAAMASGELEPLLVPGDEAVARGELSLARRHYLQALGQEPGHPAVVLRLAWLDAADPARRESARAACRQVLGYEENPGIQALLSSLDLAQNDYDAAADRLEQLAEKLGPLGRSRLELMLGRLKAPQSYTEAAVLLESAHAFDPRLVEALEALRDCYAGAGQVQQLESVGARLLAAYESPRKRGRILAELGRMFHTRFGDIDRAVRHYEDALLHWPDADRALFGLAECHSLRGDHQAALRCLEAIVRLAADRGDEALEIRAHVRAGEYWDEMGDATAAAARFHKAVALDPTSQLALERAADADLALNRVEKAAAGYQRLAEVAEGEGDLEAWRRAILRLAQLHLFELRVPGATIAVLDRLLAVYPDDAEALELRREAAAEASRLASAAPLTAPVAGGLPSPALVSEPPPPPPPEEPQDEEESASVAEDVEAPAVYPPRRATAAEDLSALIEAHLAAPDDEALAARLTERLSDAEDWPRLVAVLASRSESAESAAQQVVLLIQMADALEHGLEDRESAADTLLRAAELAERDQAIACARRAADLFRSEGDEEMAARAEAVVEGLDGQRSPEAE